MLCARLHLARDSGKAESIACSIRTGLDVGRCCVRAECAMRPRPCGAGFRPCACVRFWKNCGLGNESLISRVNATTSANPLRFLGALWQPADAGWLFAVIPLARVWVLWCLSADLPLSIKVFAKRRRDRPVHHPNGTLF